MAVDYENFWATGDYQPTSLGTEFWASIRHLLPTDSFKLLDYGCGNGAAANDLKSIPCSYAGVDISRSAIESCQSRGLSCQVIDPNEDLPFEEETFDVILSSCVVEHIVDALPAYQRSCRVLKKGGILIIRTNNMMHWRLRVDYMLLGRWNPYGDNLSIEQPWRDPHVRFFTGESLVRFVQHLGLSVEVLTGDSGRLFQWLPFVGKFSKSESSRISRALSAKLPKIFAEYITVVAHRK